MTRKTPIQLQIPTPCTQHWDSMREVKGGRFCDSCQKKVVDFTLLNDTQIVRIMNDSEEVCGRFTTSQIGRELIERRPAPLIPAMVLSTMLSTCVITSAHATEPVKTAITKDTSSIPLFKKVTIKSPLAPKINVAVPKKTDSTFIMGQAVGLRGVKLAENKDNNSLIKELFPWFK